MGPVPVSRSRALAVVLGGVSLAALSVVSAQAAPPPVVSFSPNVVADVAAGETSSSGQNEPQVTVDQSGETYLTWQLGQICADVTETKDGIHFTKAVYPDASFNPGLGCEGDVMFSHTSYTNLSKDIPVDSTGNSSIYWGDIGPSASAGCGGGGQGTPLNIQVGDSLNQGSTWINQQGAGCQEERVDRPWIAAYTPPQYRGTDSAAANTILYVEYHDFVQSDVWVESSTDGGTSWGATADDAEQTGSVGQETSTINSIPGGVAVDQYGAHQGRVYVVWSTSDVTTNATQGGNYTQAEPFDHIFLSYCTPTTASPDACASPTASWTTTTVFNDPCAPDPPTPPSSATTSDPAGTCQDVSELFSPIAVDNAGNVYVAFVWRDISKAHPEYDVYVEKSSDGGNTFNGGTLNHPGAPIRVNTDTGTHYSPWLVAGNNGAVDVVYYDAHDIDGSVAGVGEFNKPAALPGNAMWTFQMSQTLDGGQSWTQSPVSDHVQYYGDYCSTGIFCGLAPSSFDWGQDRIMYEDPGISVGPDGGARIIWTDASSSYTCAPTPALHPTSCVPYPSSSSRTCTPPTSSSDANYANDNNVSCQSGKTHVDFACQVSGMGLTGQAISGCGQVAAVSASTPESRWAPLLLLVGVAGLAARLAVRRRRRRAAG